MTEMLIRGGTVVDGTGAPAYKADVRVRDGAIAEIGANLKPAGGSERVFDATDCYVSPGFIEAHTHFDGTIYWDTQPLAGRAAVDAKMQEIGTLALAAQPEVHIKANKLVDYGAVAAVLTSAQNHSVKRIAMVGIGQSAS